MTDTAAELTRTFDGAAVPRAGTYKIDPTHSTVGFVVRHLVVSKVRGEFERFGGSFVIADDPRQSTVDVEIEVASISTREPDRDAHLVSGDFFEAERFPKITFKGDAVRILGHDRWQIDGTLTIKGVSKQVTLDAEFNGALLDPWGGTRVGFSANTEIDREEFGLTWNMAVETGGVVVGKTARVEIEIEAALEA